MIENTNTKQFYPGPILNNTLEITDFLFNDAEQIKIKHSKLNEEGILIDVDLNYPTDYEVTKVLPSDINAAEAALTASTGQIKLKNVKILAGEKLTVYRVSQIIQDKDYPRTGAFPAATHEGALDYLTMQNQEQREEIDRSLKVPISTPNFNAAVPIPLPNRILRINDEASGFEFVPYDLDQRLDTFEATVVDNITAGQEAIENSFEEFKNETNITISNIDIKATNAVDIANTASTKSDKAVNIANTASAAATNAVNISNSAVTSADTAVATANSADIKSNEALLISQEAKEASLIAEENAITAKEKVDVFEQDIEKVIEAADQIAQLESAVDTAVQASEAATKAAEDATQAAENAIASLDSKLDIDGTAVKATADAEGNIITETYANVADVLNKSQITNCLTEVPQRIKLELNNGTLTLKAGSVVTVPNGSGVFEEVKTTEDKTATKTGNNGQYLVMLPNKGTATWFDIINVNQCVSGQTDPLSGSSWHMWYDTANNQIKWYGSDGTVFERASVSLPIALVTITNNAISSIDQVFNGMGYMGSTVWVDKGVKVLIGNGYNEDGTLKNKEYTVEQVATCSATDAQSRYVYAGERPGTSTKGIWYNIKSYTYTQETEPKVQAGNVYWINPNTNLVKYTNDQGVTWTDVNCLLLGEAETGANGLVQSLNIRQVFRVARYEDMQRKADKSEVLKLNQITNCITEIPQRLNVIVADGTITLKAGSVVTVPYGTTNRTSEFPVGSQFLNSSWKVVSTQFADSKFFVWAEAQKDISRQRTETPDGNDRFITIYMDGSLNGAVSAVSGTTFSNQVGYNTSTNEVHWYNADGTSQATYMAFPIGIVACSDTQVFGSIKQVFNGIGYIGRTLWLNKDVKLLVGDGRNADGTVKNTEITTKLLLKTSHNYTEDRLLFYKKSGTLEDFLPKRYLTGFKKDMPATVLDTSLHNYFCTDTLETYWTANSTTTNWQQAEYKAPIAVYGAIKEDEGKIITFLNPYQAFRAVDYNEFKQKADKSEVLKLNQITNCITEIPQRIKCEISNNSLIVKAGSVFIIPNGSGVFTEYTLSKDLTATTGWTTSKVMLVLNEGKGGFYSFTLTNQYSGTTEPTTKNDGTVWFDTANNVVKRYNGSKWVSGLSLPLGIVQMTNGVGITRIGQIFNGFGYIGQTYWVDKGVKALCCDGRNEDGTFKNKEVTITKLKLKSYTHNNQDPLIFFIESNGNISTSGVWQYVEGINPPTNFANDARHWYNPIMNLRYSSYDNGATWNIGTGLACFAYGKGALTGGALADFQITSGTFKALDYNDKRMITSWNTPSRTYISLELGASGSTYFAPANGWFVVDLGCKAGGWVNMQSGINHYGVLCQNSAAGTVRTMLPVKAGEVMYLSYNNLNTTNIKVFSFVYAEGDQ